MRRSSNGHGRAKCGLISLEGLRTVKTSRVYNIWDILPLFLIKELPWGSKMGPDDKKPASFFPLFPHFFRPFFLVYV